MSKSVHWQVPFCSLKGVQYRVDIYDEGYTGEPVQLTGGATPFVTDEDNDDNFFAPVRIQTGQLTVIDMDGTLMETLIPSDNTARPVRLIRVSDSAVMWHGFLSCEAYSQQYTASAQELTLNVNSFLAAMDCDEINYDIFDIYRYSNLATHIRLAMNSVSDEEFRPEYVYIPVEDCQILNCNTTIIPLFSEESELSASPYETRKRGCSPLEVINRICTFAGWAAREHMGNVYFERIGGNIGYYKIALQDLYEVDEESYTAETITTKNASDLEMRGTEHEISYNRGAKEVAVESSIDSYDSDVNIPEPEFLSANVQTSLNLERVIYDYTPFKTRNTSLYAVSLHGGTYSFSTIQALVRNIALGVHYSSRGTAGQSDYYQYYGACLGKYGSRESNEEKFSLKSGLMLFVHGGGNLTEAASITSGDCVPIESNYLKIEPNISRYFTSIGGTDSLGTNENVFVKCKINIGTNYWNGTSWVSDTPQYIELKFGSDGFVGNWTSATGDAKSDALYIPVPSWYSGGVTVTIYSTYSTTGQNNYTCLFFDKLTVGYVRNDTDGYSSCKTNIFGEKIDGMYADRVTISTKLATSVNNAPSPNMLYDTSNSPVTAVSYNTEEGTEQKRPEVDLLNRMKSYYGSNRRVLSIITDTSWRDMSKYKVSGYDGKTYLPLAESRDWRTDTSTLKLFETAE